jgi:hypothetical protein
VEKIVVVVDSLRLYDYLVINNEKPPGERGPGGKAHLITNAAIFCIAFELQRWTYRTRSPVETAPVRTASVFVLCVLHQPYS